MIDQRIIIIKWFGHCELIHLLMSTPGIIKSGILIMLIITSKMTVYCHHAMFEIVTVQLNLLILAKFTFVHLFYSI